MDSHNAAFTYLENLYDADTSASGLKNSASAANLSGGFVRRGARHETLQTPYVEVEIAGEREQDRMQQSPNQRTTELVVRLHLFTDKNLVFGSAAGNQNTVVLRMNTVFHNIQPTTDNSTDWECNRIYRVSGQQLQGDMAKAHYVETYLVRLSAAVVA